MWRARPPSALSRLAVVVALIVRFGPPANAQLFGPNEFLNTNGLTDSGEDFSPQVVTDGSGTWITVWSSEDSLGGTIGTDGDVLYARSIDGGATWTAPAPLNTNAATDSGEDSSPRVATDGSGLWVAVWDSDDSLGGTLGSDRDILVTRSIDGGVSWSAPAALNTNAAVDSIGDSSPAIATDGNGVWVAAWSVQGVVVPPGGFELDIWYARSIDGGITWSPPAPLHANAGSDTASDISVHLAYDGAGSWVGIWTSLQGSTTTILYVRSTDGGLNWTAPAPLVIQGTKPQIAADGGGTLLAVSEDDFPFPGSDQEILAARSIDGGVTWTGPIQITSNMKADDGPQVAGDGAGNWLAMWSARDPVDGDFDMRIARSADNGLTWTTPTDLNVSTSGDQRTDFTGSITTDRAGRWVAAWFSTDFSGTIGEDNDILTARGTICGDGMRVLPEACDDGNTLDWDCCSASCGPQTGCRVPTIAGKSKLLIKDRNDDAADLLGWKWLKGQLTTAGDVGNPAGTDGYYLCMYDESGPTPALVFRAAIPPGGMCGAGPCWTTTGPGAFDYRHADGAPEGVEQINLHPGANGKARIRLKGRGENLSNRTELNLPAPPLALPLRVQLQTSNQRCWEATYSTAKKNAPGEFRAKSD